MGDVDAATNAFRAALVAGRVTHWFQPIWYLATGALFGFEALARFPEGVPPDQVWSAAATYGACRRLDRLSILSALEEAVGLPGALFMNLDSSHVGAPNWPSPAIGKALAEYRPAHGSTVMEITEARAIGTEAMAKLGAGRLRSLGVHVALDDAGTGQATAERLYLLRPEIVKLDRPLVVDFLERSDARLPRWVAMARRVGALVVAEGVEDASSVDRLVDAGIDLVQGFAFGRPAPADGWLAARSPLREFSPRRGRQAATASLL